ncbi:MAG: murein L,D-transpeptidase catalytic domain-containing protein [Chitinophagales bacterium]
MKTSGIIRISAAIFFAVITGNAIPASAQLYFASQTSFSSTGTDKKFIANNTLFNEAKPFIKESYLSVISTVAPRNAMNDSGSLLKTTTSDSISTEINKTNENSEINFRATPFVYPTNSKKDVGIDEYPSQLLLVYARALKDYARKNGFDTSYAFLSNMGILCNRKRFFIINLTTMEIEESGLVSHGRGQGPTIYDKQYSNKAGSKCTSLGRYKIVNKYKGSYGESYRMIGLDSTNCNAFSRNIVLHSLSCIPEAENTFPACVSDGCPAVSPKFLSSLGRIIDTREKPVLLWIFDSNLEEPMVEWNDVGSVSIGFSATSKKISDIDADHRNDQLHFILNRSTHKNKLFRWLSEQKRKITRPNSARRNSEEKGKNPTKKLPAGYLFSIVFI